VRLMLLTVVSVAVMAASVLYASEVQRSTAQSHAVEARSALGALASVNQAEAALSTFALTDSPQARNDYGLAVQRLDRGLAAAGRTASDDGMETHLVRVQQRFAAEFEARVNRDLAAGGARRQRAALRADAGARHALVGRFTAANDALQARQAVLAPRENDRAALTAPVLIVLLSAMFGSAAAVVRRRSRRAERRVSQDGALQERFGEAMQVADSQAEAHRLLKTHLERLIPGGLITVLNRNNSADRLEANTALIDGSALSEALKQARPRSCMAVRLSRPFHHGPTSDEVLSCEVCGVLESETTCQPLLVGGEVIGSVLAEHTEALTPEDGTRIAVSVAQSAPVLANLRNLAIAETRAATDALTGLPNRRAVDDTLLRVLAQAGRSFNPVSAILLDLDHFKRINDTHGHDRGDEVLAAFAARLREVLRASDFAGRSGGEEFVIFLPDTDRTGAVRLAEKIRTAMRGLTVPGLDGDITASFGIACFPDDAVEAAALMRCADRALYAAKRGGRDRIEASSTGAQPVATPEHVI